MNVGSWIAHINRWWCAGTLKIFGDLCSRSYHRKYIIEWLWWLQFSWEKFKSKVFARVLYELLKFQILSHFNYIWGCDKHWKLNCPYKTIVICRNLGKFSVIWFPVVIFRKYSIEHPGWMQFLREKSRIQVFARVLYELLKFRILSHFNCIWWCGVHWKLYFPYKIIVICRNLGKFRWSQNILISAAHIIDANHTTCATPFNIGQLYLYPWSN